MWVRVPRATALSNAPHTGKANALVLSARVACGFAGFAAGAVLAAVDAGASGAGFGVGPATEDAGCVLQAAETRLQSRAIVARD